MNLVEQTERFRNHLQVWAEVRGGQVSVIANPRHLWEEFASHVLAGAKPRILLMFTGETPRATAGAAYRTWRVDRMWTVVVIRGHGFLNALTHAVEDQPEAFYAALEDLRDTLRVVGDLSLERPIWYRGIRSLPNLGQGNAANIFLDAFTLEFSTANDIPAVEFTP